MKKTNTLLLITSIFFSISSAAQKADLSDKNLQAVNRDMSVIKTSDGKTVVHLNGKPNDGLAWVKDLTFNKGVIEFDVKGKNVMQQSFVGIAYHGQNDSTFEGIYFRPFNFQSPDPARKSHSVQYIAMPQYDWEVLREKFPGKYESALLNTVDPESWVHAKFVVAADNISVYINKDDKPSLVVRPIVNLNGTKIGFWVGNNSEGDFSNLSIQSK